MHKLSANAGSLRFMAGGFSFLRFVADNPVVPALNNSFFSFFTSTGSFISNIFSALLNGLASVLYAICKFVLNLIDFLQLLVQKLSGLDVWMNVDKVDISNLTSSDIVFRFLFSDTVVTVFKAVVSIFFVLLILFTIIAIIKNEYAGATSGEPQDHKKSIYTALKAILTVVLVPVMLVGGIICSNAILAGLAKAFSLGSSLTMGGQIFVVSSYDANDYRKYVSTGNRVYTSNTTSFVMPTINADGTYNMPTINADGTYDLSDTQTVTISTAIPIINPADYSLNLDLDDLLVDLVTWTNPLSNINIFYGYMFTFDGSTYYLWQCDLSERYQYYYYIKYVLDAYIAEPEPSRNAALVNFYNKQYNSNLTTGTASIIESAQSMYKTYIAGSNDDLISSALGLDYVWVYDETYNNSPGYFLSMLDYLEYNDPLIKAAYNTWYYNEVLTKSYSGWGSSMATLNSTQTQSTTMAGTSIVYNTFTNDPYWACYHDGGINGLVALPQEYKVMADVVDFMLNYGVTLYFVNANNSNIEWQKMGSSDNAYAYQQYLYGAAGGNPTGLFVSYSDAAAGTVLYNINSSAVSEIDGATYIMCWYNSLGGYYVPLTNNTTYTDDLGKSYSFSSSQYASSYQGPVIARGLFQSSSYLNTYQPTYLTSTMVGGTAGSDFDSTKATMAAMEINRNDYTAVEMLTSIDDTSLTFSSNDNEDTSYGNVTITAAGSNDITISYYGIEYSFNETQDYLNTSLTKIAEALKNNVKYNSISPTNVSVVLSNFVDNGDSGKDITLVATFTFEDTVNNITYTVNYTFTSTGQTETENTYTYNGTEYKILQYNFSISDFSTYNFFKVVQFTQNKNNSDTFDSSISTEKLEEYNNLTINSFIENSSSVQTINGKNVTVYTLYNENYDIYINAVKSNNSSIDDGYTLISIYDIYNTGTTTTNGNTHTYITFSFNNLDAYTTNGESITISSSDVANLVYKSSLINYVLAPEYSFISVEGDTTYLYMINTTTDTTPDSFLYYKAALDLANGSFDVTKVYTYKISSKISTDNTTIDTKKSAKEYINQRLKFFSATVNTSGFYNSAQTTGGRYTTTLTGSNTSIVITSESASATDTTIYQPQNIINTAISYAVGTTTYTALTNVDSTNVKNKISNLASTPTSIAFCRDQMTTLNLVFDRKISFISPSVVRLNLTISAVNKSNTSDYVTLNLALGAISLDYNFEGTVKINNLYQVAYMQWVILIFAMIIVFSILGKAVWGLIRRIYEITLLYLIMPAVASTLPLDPKGNRFTKWREQLIGQVLGAYGVTIGLNFFFIIVPVIRDASAIFTDADVAGLSSTLRFFVKDATRLNNLVYILFILVAFTLLKTVPSMIQGFVFDGDKGAGEVISQGERTVKQVHEVVKDVGDTLSGGKIIEGFKEAKKLGKNLIPGSALYDAYKNKQKEKQAAAAQEDLEAHQRGANAQRQQIEQQAAAAQEAANAANDANAQNETTGANNNPTGPNGTPTGANNNPTGPNGTPQTDTTNPQNDANPKAETPVTPENKTPTDNPDTNNPNNDAAAQTNAAQQYAEAARGSAEQAAASAAAVQAAQEMNNDAASMRQEAGVGTGEVPDQMKEAIGYAVDDAYTASGHDAATGFSEQTAINVARQAAQQLGLDADDKALQGAIGSHLPDLKSYSAGGVEQEIKDTAAAAVMDIAGQQYSQSAGTAKAAENAETADKAKNGAEAKPNDAQSGADAAARAEKSAEAAKLWSEAAKISADIAKDNVGQYEAIYEKPTDKRLEKAQRKQAKLYEKYQEAQEVDGTEKAKHSIRLSKKDIEEWNSTHGKAEQITGEKSREQKLLREQARQIKYATKLGNKIEKQDAIVKDAEQGIYRGVRGWVSRTILTGRKTSDQRVKDVKKVEDKQLKADVLNSLRSGKVKTAAEYATKHAMTGQQMDAFVKKYGKYFNPNTKLLTARSWIANKQLKRAKEVAGDDRSGLLHAGGNIARTAGRVVASKGKAALTLTATSWVGKKEKSDDRKTADAAKVQSLENAINQNANFVKDIGSNKAVEFINKAINSKDSTIRKIAEKLNKPLENGGITNLQARNMLINYNKKLEKQLDKAKAEKLDDYTGVAHKIARGVSRTLDRAKNTAKDAPIIKDINNYVNEKHQIRKEASQINKQLGKNFTKVYGDAFNAKYNIRQAALDKVNDIKKEKYETAYNAQVEQLRKIAEGEIRSTLNKTNKAELKKLIDDVKNGNSQNWDPETQKRFDYYLNRNAAKLKSATTKYFNRLPDSKKIEVAGLNNKSAAANAKYKEDVEKAAKEAIADVNTKYKISEEKRKAFEANVNEALHRPNISSSEISKICKQELKKLMTNDQSGKLNLQVKHLQAMVEQFRNADRSYKRNIKNLQTSQQKLSKQVKNQKSKNALDQATKQGGHFGDDATGK